MTDREQLLAAGLGHTWSGASQVPISSRTHSDKLPETKHSQSPSLIRRPGSQSVSSEHAGSAFLVKLTFLKVVLLLRPAAVVLRNRL